LGSLILEAGELQEAGQHESKILIEDDGVEVEEGPAVEGDFEVSPEEASFGHFPGDALLGQEVHDQQIKQKHCEPQADVVDVAEEVDVSGVGVEVDRRGVVEFKREPLFPAARVHCDVLVLHLADSAQRVPQKRRRSQTRQEDVQPDLLKVVHKVSADRLQAQEETRESNVNHEP